MNTKPTHDYSYFYRLCYSTPLTLTYKNCITPIRINNLSNVKLFSDFIKLENLFIQHKRVVRDAIRFDIEMY